MTSDQTEQKMVWDWWPLARLLITASIFGLGAHYYLGWTLDLRALATLPRWIFEVLSFCALISFGLAHLYLILLMFPIYTVVTLNDTFYDAGRRVCFSVFRIKSAALLAAGWLCGEIFLFGTLAYLLRKILA